MEWRERITANPEVLVGKPVVRGTRLSVELIVSLLGNGWTFEEILASYPGLSVDDIRACLLYAAEVLTEERLYPVVTG
ncbi:MAG: DUF433 domain-containing protein [Bryobacteraceae bacterium]|nr:DUF433 domain-containing protein [Bryobacteraceae bacterium]